MWCVRIYDKKARLLDNVLYDNKSTDEDLASLFEEFNTIKELKYLRKKIYSYNVEEIPDIDFKSIENDLRDMADWKY